MDADRLFEILRERIPDDQLRHVGAALVNGWPETGKDPNRRYLLGILQSQGITAIPRSIPPWRLHEGKGYETKTASELADHLERTREERLSLSRELKPELWIRKGTVMGKTASILDLGTWLANHDQGHLSQI